ncbi:A-kinase anchor protein 10, mitochondrial-like isoform X2 [Panonychus citri]|uniref:A-kinase anchor protein 10, mitochondrial-like isoform X2 n=1 Tax=Panonychus citri TaxID=50023 RepID=UPI002307EC9C|nr:A-kinase anchor protein 10, mitochondrial-like isoform X2 [Panonychus citri]
MNLNFFRRKANKNRENGINAILSMGNEITHTNESSTCSPFTTSTPPFSSSSSSSSSVAATTTRKTSSSTLEKLPDITRSPFSSSSNRNNSLSSIALRASLNSPGISSHRNLNRSYQMQIAEAIYDENKPLETRSRLSPTLMDILKDHESLSYFVQFMESRGSTSKQLIRLWIQLECFQRFSKEFITSEIDFKLDAEGIWDKFLSHDKYKQLGISDVVVTTIESRLADSSSPVGENLFKDLAEWIVNHLETSYYNQYCKSYYFCKYQVSVLTSGHLRLPDILYNDSTLFYFMEFMEHETMNHYIDFLVMAENVRKTDCITKDDLTILYQRFFSIESPSYLEMSETLKCQIEESVRRGDKSSFDKPISILMQYFEETYFQQFLSSQTFFSFLDESIKSLQINSEPGLVSSSRVRRDSGSSDRSGPLTSQQSLSSSSLSVVNCGRDLNSKPCLSNLDDYDSIWRRDYATDLQMVTVDRYGKVISHFQPQPVNRKSNGLSLSRAVKMFRQNSLEEKEKEELAYKVAQMIIDDVFAVTQGSVS